MEVVILLRIRFYGERGNYRAARLRAPVAPLEAIGAVGHGRVVRRGDVVVQGMVGASAPVGAAVLPM